MKTIPSMDAMSLFFYMNNVLQALETHLLWGYSDPERTCSIVIESSLFKKYLLDSYRTLISQEVRCYFNFPLVFRKMLRREIHI